MVFCVENPGELDAALQVTHSLSSTAIRLDPTCDCDDVTVSLYFVTCRQYLLFKSNKA